MSADLITRLNAALEGRYRIEGELGEGGMATVYLADDLKHERKVALKVLKPELAAVVGADRFLAEIKTTANLQHPAILPLHDSGAADGFLYYVMPYVRGATLKDRIASEGPLPLEEVSRITDEIAGGLAHAHASGVVHRDVKPANVLLSDGHAVLADFGISQAPRTELEEKLTGTGGVGGTIRYMSPEQIQGDVELGPRSDQYALACVVYEMLCGEPPFRGGTAWAVIASQMGGEIKSVAVVRPGVSLETDAVISRALEPDPEDRFADTTDFADAVVKSLAVARADGLSVKRPASRAVWASLGAVAVVLAATMWTQWTPSVDLDPDRVIVFPLVDQRSGSHDATVGEQVAIMVGTSLEHAEPLRWIDGWDWLDPSVRGDMASWSIRDGTAIARDRGAKHVIDGRILTRGDSVGVMLRLHDAQSGDLVQTSLEIGSPDVLLSLGRRAVVPLLANLIDPGGPVSTDALQKFAPDVVSDWLRVSGSIANRASIRRWSRSRARWKGIRPWRWPRYGEPSPRAGSSRTDRRWR